ncbi:translational GTPase TypA [Spiroplasma endosymbiont of Labia minor]|uniref:translational GTPase TypA n=1 Tax=Spiroplasma endosymbiont of Labia minor TaxID=3066305 RepID=UPI0030CD8EDD
MTDQKIINIAVIAHVDAGKSTLVDAFLSQSGVFRTNEVVKEQVMDSNDQERERGITIYSKNCSIQYKDYKINIVDTPGHADFSSEVERIMKTVDTVILLVDSSEGPMPQTRFVLSKALELGLKPILLINKIDKKDQRALEVVDEVLELFMELDANEEQLEFPTLFGIAKKGIVQYDMETPSIDLSPLFETIVKQTGSYPIDLSSKNTQLQISSLAYDAFIGRLGIGRLFEGTIKEGQQIIIAKNNNGGNVKGKIVNLFVYQGLKRVQVKEAYAGDIVVISGLAEISIGDTICDVNDIRPMPPIHIEEPTMSMNFLVNTSPFAGKVGKFVTTRNIKERLEKELEVNVGMKVESLSDSSADGFKVLGRGELHLSVLIETMRREGFELGISKPEVIFHIENGVKMEPVENVIISVPTEYSGTVINKLNLRKGMMTNMDSDGIRDRIEYRVPMRGLIGFRTEFTNDTHGEGILVRSVDGFEEYKGVIQGRQNGVLVSMTNGITLPYALNNLEERGKLFVGPQVEVYEGMIVGLHSRDNDLDVNPTTGKKLTNTRASGSDDAVKLTPPVKFSLEEALEFIEWDELVEVVPNDIRLRKRWLTQNERKQHRSDPH